MKTLLAARPGSWPALSPPPMFPNSQGSNIVETNGVQSFATYVADNDPRTAADWAAFIATAVPDQSASNKSAMVDNLAQDLVAMQAIIDATNATINSNPAPHIKAQARMLRRLGRLASNDLSGTT